MESGMVNIVGMSLLIQIQVVNIVGMTACQLPEGVVHIAGSDSYRMILYHH
jgi:hypothetical protein